MFVSHRLTPVYIMYIHTLCSCVDTLYHRLTAAMDEDSGRVIEAGVKVRLQGGYVLGQVDPTMHVVTCIQES